MFFSIRLYYIVSKLETNNQYKVCNHSFVLFFMMVKQAAILSGKREIHSKMSWEKKSVSLKENSHQYKQLIYLFFLENLANNFAIFVLNKAVIYRVV